MQMTAIAAIISHCFPRPTNDGPLAPTGARHARTLMPGGAPLSTVSREGATQLVAAAGQVGGLGGVARQLDGFVAALDS